MELIATLVMVTHGDVVDGRGIGYSRLHLIATSSYIS